MYRLEESVNVSEAIVGGKALRLALIQSIGIQVKKALILEPNEVLNILVSGSVTQTLLNTIYGNLNFDNGIAVRSSAIGEDGILSWAGQFRSELFVSKNELELAILNCASALNSESVKSYANLHGTNSDRLALLLQEMVPALLSGVMFTHHPVTLSDQVMVIEVVTGVAEGLVSGKSEPKRYFVDSTNCNLLREEGSSSPSLSSEQIKDLVSIGQILKKYFGCGQDVEWAIEQNSGLLYINQSRNITTDNYIFSTTEEVIASVDKKLQEENYRLSRLECILKPDILSDQNISEILTPHPTQMSFGLFTYLFAHGQGAIRTARNEMGYDIGEELSSGFFHLVSGQPRCSIIHDAFSYRIQGIPLDDYCKLVDYYLNCIRENPLLANYPEIQLYQQNPSYEFLTKFFDEEKATRYALAYKDFFAKIRDLEVKLREECQTMLIEWDNNLLSLATSTYVDTKKLQTLFFEICELLRTQGCRLFVKVARLGFFSYTRLRNLLQELFGENADNYLNTLIGGISLEENPNLRFNYDLRLFKDEILDIDTILAQYGHLACHELEISTPRYSDQPQIIKELAKKIESTDEENFVDSRLMSEKLMRELILSVGDKKEILLHEVGVTRTYLPLREKVKFHFLKGYALLRQTAVRIEEQLQWPKGLIFYLNPEEVFQISENEFEMQALATRRKEQREKEDVVEVPPVVFAENLSKIGESTSNPSNTLYGIGVTNTITEGEVVVVRELNEHKNISRLSQGKVLVTTTTDPAWSPILAILGKKGALVTEVGGLLAHGAIYAREMSIAAVLNVPHATKILKDGMKVRINGPKGTVEILI